MIPRYHGDIETNLGLGSVFDLVVDHNGTVSKSLGYYLSSSEKTHEHYEYLSRALDFLKDYLLEEKILTMTLKPKNILCKTMKSGELRLFVVDNIGNSDFVPICNYSSYLAKKKILRKWKRFEHRMLNLYEHNNALHMMLTAARSHAKYWCRFSLTGFINYLLIEEQVLLNSTSFSVIT